jgi:high-affinity Fe2+/Pb2+ permease
MRATSRWSHGIGGRMPFLVAFVIAFLVTAGFGRIVLRAFGLLALGMLLFFVVAITASVMVFEIASHSQVAGQHAAAPENLPASQRGSYGLTRYSPSNCSGGYEKGY